MANQEGQVAEERGSRQHEEAVGEGESRTERPIWTLRRAVVWPLGEQLTHHFRPLVICQGCGEAVPGIGQFIVIEPECVEQGGVPIKMPHFVDDRFVAPLVGFPPWTYPLLNPPPGNPHTETIGVVISTPFFTTGIILEDGEASHLAGPLDDGAVKKAPLFQVGNECCGRLRRRRRSR